MNQRACVVEVVEQVAEADVAIVAARVGERLAMAPERVRKLIEGRTGPITRALRADKADAIAQTFEAAGVRVVIRPAEPEELEDLPGAMTRSTAERAAAAVPASVEGARAAAAAEAAREPRAEPAPVREPDAEPAPVREPDPAPLPEPDEPDEPEFDMPDPDVPGPLQPEPDPEPAPAPPFEPDAPDEGADDDDSDAAGARFAPDPSRYDDDDDDDEVDADGLDGDAVDADGLDGDDDDDDEVDADGPDGDGADPDDAAAHAPHPDDASVRVPMGAGHDDEPLDDDAAEDGVIDVDDDEDPAHAAASEMSRFASTGEWVAVDAGVWSTSRPPLSPTEAGAWPPDADEDGAVVVDDDEGDDDAAGPPPAEAAPAVGRDTRRPRAVVMPVSDDAAEPRAVPLAWRGLGPDRAGPARPVDAPLPRRREPEALIEIPDPRRRRRGVMLVWLAIAVVAFLLSQWWVASRAGAAFDATAGVHAFRDGDFAAARRYWGAQASAGDPAAQFMLGYLAEAGLGAPWSARAAAAWYRAAADGGYAEAAWRLGRLYEAGLGVAPDDAEARRWFRAAADLGHGEAAFALGRSWMRALGVAWGREGVATWPDGTVDELAGAFERAAELGFHEAAPYAASLAAARAAAGLTGR